jgi:DNA-binding MarR family transcriptional regulator
MRALNFDLRQVARLDRVLHEPARLSIAACLSELDEADFVFLQSQTGMTVGNLSSHVKKMDAAGYVTIRKEFVDSRPRTTLKLTRTGKAAFRNYLKRMRDLLESIT